MKKIILAALAVCTFGAVNAQKVNYGIKAGLNIASQRVSDFEGDAGTLTLKSIAGLQVGGFAEIKLTDKFAVQPEALYSMEGSEMGPEAKIKLSYINVPVMLKYYANEKLNLQVGPQVGFLVSADAKSNGITEDAKDYYETVNFGANFGLGYEFTPKCFVDLRYNLGLINMAKSDFVGDSTLKSSVFSIAVGYKL